MTANGLEKVRHESTALPSNAEITAQLNRIRSSADFDVPERARKFLSYVIEEAIAGRADRIKAYSIATVVFGRDPSFDAQNDPVVRIEAGRLRRALERYYLVAGRQDPIVITIPKGGYVPIFHTRIGTATKFKSRSSGRGVSSVFNRYKFLWSGFGILPTIAILATLGASGFLALKTALEKSATNTRETLPKLPRLVVMPFEDLSSSPQSEMITRGLTDEVISNLSKFKEITVATNEGIDGLQSPDPAQGSPPVYALEGRVRIDGSKLRLGIRLVQHPEGSVVWANNYDEDLRPHKVLELQARAAAAIASAIAQPYGVMFQANATHLTHAVPDDWQAYACTLSYYGYRANLDPQAHTSVRECLTDATRRFPGYATAWALLSLTYVDELRFRNRLGGSSTVALDRAIETAARAVELDPQNVRALQARMVALFFRGQVDAALAVGARAFAINPSDTELAGEYGFRLALSGQWGTGCELVSKTVDRNPGPVGYFQAALAVCCYIRRDYVAAEKWARLSDLRANPIFHVILLATLGKLGKTDEARIERRWLETNAPGVLKNIGREVALRIHRTEDQLHFLEGLRQAGVSISPDTSPQGPGLRPLR